MTWEADFASSPAWDTWPMDVSAEEGCRRAQDSLTARGFRLLEPVKKSDDGSYTLRAGTSKRRFLIRNAHLFFAGSMVLSAVTLVATAVAEATMDIKGDAPIIPMLIMLFGILMGAGGLREARKLPKMNLKLMEVTVLPTTDGRCRVLVKGTPMPVAKQTDLRDVRGRREPPEKKQ